MNNCKVCGARLTISDLDDYCNLHTQPKQGQIEELTPEQIENNRDVISSMGYGSGGREAFWRLQDNYNAQAQKIKILTAQLSQEKEERKKLEKFLGAFIDGHSLLNMFKEQEHAIASRQK